MIGMVDAPSSLRFIRVEAQKGFCRILQLVSVSLGMVSRGHIDQT